MRKLLDVWSVRDRIQQLREEIRADERHAGHPHLEYRLTKSAFQTIIMDVEIELEDIRQEFFRESKA